MSTIIKPHRWGQPQYQAQEICQVDVNNNELSTYKVTPMLVVWLAVFMLLVLAVFAIFEVVTESENVTLNTIGVDALIFSLIAFFIFVYSFSYVCHGERVTIYRFGKLKGTYCFDDVVKISTIGKPEHWCCLNLELRDGTEITVDSLCKNEFKFYTDVYSYITRVEYPLSDKQKKWFDDLSKVK